MQWEQLPPKVAGSVLAKVLPRPGAPLSEGGARGPNKPWAKAWGAMLWTGKTPEVLHQLGKTV